MYEHIYIYMRLFPASRPSISIDGLNSISRLHPCSPVLDCRQWQLTSLAIHNTNSARTQPQTKTHHYYNLYINTQPESSSHTEKNKHTNKQYTLSRRHEANTNAPLHSHIQNTV